MSYLGRAADEWAAGLSSDDPLERRLAAHALAETEPPEAAAAGALHDALEDDEPFVRVWAAAALARVAPGDGGVLSALVDGLAADQAFVRSLAAWHIGRLGAAYPGIDVVLSALDAATRDSDANVRAEAALALRRCTTKQRSRAPAGGQS